MLKVKYIIKDIENEILFGSGFIHTLTCLPYSNKMIKE